MEKLAAEYEKTHDVRITINMSSSGNGIKDTQNGLNDFGMSSRDLKDKETGVKGEVLCRDGIALIVNKDCAVDNVTKADVKALYESGTGYSRYFDHRGSRQRRGQRHAFGVRRTPRNRELRRRRFNGCRDG